MLDGGTTLPDAPELGAVEACVGAGGKGGMFAAAPMVGAALPWCRAAVVTVLEAGNGFLGMVLLALSPLDRGETTCWGCCGATKRSSSGESR